MIYKMNKSKNTNPIPWNDLVKVLLTPQAFVALLLVPIIIFLLIDFNKKATKKEFDDVVKSIAFSFANGIINSKRPIEQINNTKKNSQLVYLVWQTNNGIVAASENIEISDNFFSYQENFSNRTNNFELYQNNIFDNNSIYELIIPFEKYNFSNSFLRVGISIKQLQQLKSKNFKRFIAVIVIGVLVAIILVNITFFSLQHETLKTKYEKLIIEISEMEKEKERNERAISMGKFAAGIAHEIKNPLNAISLILQKISGNINIKNNFNLINRAANEIDKVKAILENFLQYARPPEIISENTNINTLCSNAIELVRLQADQFNVAILFEPTDVPILKLDPEQTQQALLNIIQNALEAMPNGGHLTVATFVYDSNILISVADTGIGVPDNQKNNIFDMYFTTKEKGTGIGLAYVNRIISCQNGFICIEDNIPKGTIFKISFKCN